jgi:hypothetical protein
MSTDTDPKRDFGDDFDLQSVMAGWSASYRDATDRLLELYEQAIGRIAETHVNQARATDITAVITLAETQATLSREIADAYVRSVRGLLET